MSTEIYYFSGTGNSLAVARDINQKLNGELISISSLINEKGIRPQADIIGIVFPTYYEPHGGVPLIVRRFVKKLENIQDKYIFAICTYGAVSVNALDFLDDLIQAQKGRVAAKFAVNMPTNMGKSKDINLQKQQKMIQVWEENSSVLVEHINNHADVKWDAPNLVFGKFYGLIKFIIKPFTSSFEHSTLKKIKEYPELSKLNYEEFLPHMDKTFNVNENCNGCATCSQICPTQNIAMLDETPTWQHKCEFCLACIHWCEKKAIQTSAMPELAKYHNPHIKVSDMLNTRTVK
jgi:formate hydrogenlyase subunit 6/NADH:ubiquinone oxidoreductase subunit I/flavodoxin